MNDTKKLWLEWQTKATLPICSRQFASLYPSKCTCKTITALQNSNCNSNLHKSNHIWKHHTNTHTLTILPMPWVIMTSSSHEKVTPLGIFPLPTHHSALPYRPKTLHQAPYQNRKGTPKLVSMHISNVLVWKWMGKGSFMLHLPKLLACLLHGKPLKLDFAQCHQSLQHSTLQRTECQSKYNKHLLRLVHTAQNITLYSNRLKRVFVQRTLNVYW